MSKADEARRVRWGYEPYTPTCASCRNFKKAKLTTARGAPPVLTAPRCGPGKFDVAPHGCCDKWVSRTGERLA